MGRCSNSGPGLCFHFSGTGWNCSCPEPGCFSCPEPGCFSCSENSGCSADSCSGNSADSDSALRSSPRFREYSMAGGKGNIREMSDKKRYQNLQYYAIITNITGFLRSFV